MMPVRIPDSPERSSQLSNLQRLVLWLVGALVIGVLVIGLVVGAIRSPRPGDRPAPTPTAFPGAGPSLPSPSPTPTPCDPYTDLLEAIQRLISGVNFEAAADLGWKALEDPSRPGCPESRTEVARLAYEAEIEAMFARPGDGAPLIGRWTRAEQRADRFGLPPSKRRPPLAIAQRAFHERRWDLARHAFLKAWAQGAFRPCEPQASQFYYELLWQGGAQKARNPQTRLQGIQWLLLARDLSQVCQLGRREADRELGRLGPLPSPQPFSEPDPYVEGARGK